MRQRRLRRDQDACARLDAFKTAIVEALRELGTKRQRFAPPSCLSWVSTRAVLGSSELAQKLAEEGFDAELRCVTLAAAVRLATVQTCQLS